MGRTSLAGFDLQDLTWMDGIGVSRLVAVVVICVLGAKVGYDTVAGLLKGRGNADR